MSAIDHGTDSTVRRIEETVNGIKDPCSLASATPMGLVDMGLVENISMTPDGDALVAIRLTTPFCVNIGYLKGEVEDRVSQLTGVRSVAVTVDQGVAWSPELMSEDVQRRRLEIFPVRS